jgi:hypothetical protein
MGRKEFSANLVLIRSFSFELSFSEEIPGHPIHVLWESGMELRPVANPPTLG